MTTTTKNARDECMRKVKKVLDTFPGTGARWPGAEQWEPPSAQSPWWWPTMQHLNSQQASLSCEHGLRRWQRDGVITVMCFGKTFAQAEEMAVALREEFEGSATPGGVWFRNATANEVGPDASWYRWDFQVNFQYDQVR